MRAGEAGRRLTQEAKRRLGRSERFRRVGRRLSRVPSDRTWVFILGCYNSGTTLLHDLVTSSDDCARLPGEGAFLTSELVTPDVLGWTRMWWKVYEEMKNFRVGGGGDPEIVRRDWCIWFDTSRPVFVEKSISNAVRIEWLDQSFPDCKFIYVIRNGYAVAEGIRRRAGRGRFPLPEGIAEYPISWCAQQWVTSSQVINRDLGRIDDRRVFRLTYEDLCHRPALWLEQMWTFIGARKASPMPAIQVHDMNPTALARLSDADILSINEVAERELTLNGYEVLRRAAAG